MIFWMTGLSGSGKTTLAKLMQYEFENVILLDGDELRKTINSDLGHDPESKKENGRRMIELCKFLTLQGFDIIVPTIAGNKKSRDWVASELSEFGIRFLWIKCSIEECMRRDPKGLYKKDLKNFVGLDIPYEEPYPHSIDLVIDTENRTPSECCNIFANEIKMFGNI